MTPAAGAELAPAEQGPFRVWPIPQEAAYGDGPASPRATPSSSSPRATAAPSSPGRLLAELVADQFGVALPVAIGEAPPGRTAIVVGEASHPLVAAAAARAGLDGP